MNARPGEGLQMWWNLTSSTHTGVWVDQEVREGLGHAEHLRGIFPPPLVSHGLPVTGWGTPAPSRSKLRWEDVHWQQQ